MEAFTGRPRDLENATEHYVPKTEDIVLRLVDRVGVYQDMVGTVLTFDNLYTSIPLSKKLLERGITWIGKDQSL